MCVSGWLLRRYDTRQTGLQKAAAAIERQMFDEGAWQRRDPQTWEEFEKAGKARKKRADEEKKLDDTEPFR